MATTVAAEKREDKENNVRADEGVEALTPYKGPVADIVDEFCAGIQSGLSYCGGHTIQKAREKAEFIRVAPSAKEREGYHSDHDWEGISADSEVKAINESQNAEKNAQRIASGSLIVSITGISTGRIITVSGFFDETVKIRRVAIAIASEGTGARRFGVKRMGRVEINFCGAQHAVPDSSESTLLITQ